MVFIFTKRRFKSPQITSTSSLKAAQNRDLQQIALHRQNQRLAFKSRLPHHFLRLLNRVNARFESFSFCVKFGFGCCLGVTSIFFEKRGAGFGRPAPLRLMPAFSSRCLLAPLQLRRVPALRVPGMQLHIYQALCLPENVRAHFELS